MYKTSYADKDGKYTRDWDTFDIVDLMDLHLQVDGEYLMHRINWECIKINDMERLMRLAASKCSFGFKEMSDAHLWNAMRSLAYLEVQAGHLTEADYTFIDELLPEE